MNAFNLKQREDRVFKAMVHDAYAMSPSTGSRPKATRVEIYNSVLATFATIALCGIFVLLAVLVGILAVPLNNLFYNDDYNYYIRVTSQP